MNDEARLGEPDCNFTRPWSDHNNSGSKGRHPVGENSTRKGLKRVPTPIVDLSFIDAVQKVGDEATDILIKKQADYGPLNISRAPGGPLNGLQVRIFDKVSRINNLIQTGATPENESLRDSFLDLANYGLIALMVLDGTWPQLPGEIA